MCNLRVDYPDYCEEFAIALVTDDPAYLADFYLDIEKEINIDEFYSNFTFKANNVIDFDIDDGWEERDYIFEYKGTLYGITYTYHKYYDIEINRELWLAEPIIKQTVSYKNIQNI